MYLSVPPHVLVHFCPSACSQFLSHHNHQPLLYPANLSNTLVKRESCW